MRFDVQKRKQHAEKGGVMAEQSGISHELDALASEMFGQCFDALAEGNTLWPLVSVEDQAGARETIEFAEDDPNECLIAARAYIREKKSRKKREKHGHKGQDSASELGDFVRYALGYDALVRDEESGELLSAVIVEFGEAGAPSAYSGFSYYQVGKTPADFMWTDPQPAGEEDLLL